MRHVSRPLAVLLAGTLSATGCATAHLKGEYSPQYLPPGQAKEITGTSEKSTIVKGHDWVLFWGLAELASSDLHAKVRRKLRPDEILTDVEVRNHVSLPGVLLWIVTAGLVSHHDLDLRGRVAYVKEREIPKTISAVPVAPYTRERTIVIPAPVGSAAPRAGYTRGEELTGEDLYSENVIDRPIGDVASNFNEAAMRAGLIPLADIRWNGMGTDRPDLRGEIPQNRLEGVADSNVRTLIVTNDRMIRDVKSDPHCGAFIPGVVLFEKGGQTHLFYAKPTGKLRMMRSQGFVGADRAMTQSKYDEHMLLATDFEKSMNEVVTDLNSSSRTGDVREGERGRDMRNRDDLRNGERTDETTPRNDGERRVENP